MFRIGEFSKIAQVSGRLLRYYDEIGLLSPESVGPETGYRYYSARQLPRLNRILVLKELGLSLEQIARLLEQDTSPDEIRGMLALRKAQIEQSVQEEMARFHQKLLYRRTTMTTLDTLTQRNSDFAAHRFVAGFPMMPTLRTMIIGCVDPRVDPTHLLGLDPGEALVIRNIGGRITPATLQTMAMLQTIAQVQGANPGGGFHLLVLHHTDCGITRLEGKPEMLAGYFGIGKGELEAKAVTDPRTSVAVDVAALKANPLFPGDWLVSGLVCDVATGLVEVVVPIASLKE